MEENYQNGISFDEVSPGWQAEGAEPREELKNEGFFAGYCPPAGYFNWFWTRVSRCISELQQKVSATVIALQSHSKSKENPHSVTKAQVGLGNVNNYAALPLSGGTMNGSVVNTSGSFHAPRFFATDYMSIGYSVTGFWYDEDIGELQARVGNYYAVRNTTGSTFMPILAAAFNPTSSVRYKEEITNLTEEEALLLFSLKPKRYRLKGLGDIQYGFIAEEVDLIDKNYVVYDNKEQPEALNYMSMIAPMILLLQKQEKQIDSLQTQLLQIQNAQMNTLESQVEENKV